jgi:hypothetical protein
MDTFETILNSLPEKPARSRLDPYADLIKELLGRGWTYREIAQILLDKCGVRISFSTIHHFVHARLRSKRKLPKSHPQNLEQKALVPTVGNEEVASPEKQTAADDDVYCRIAALKLHQASPEERSTLFRYNPDEPLHLPSKPKKLKNNSSL